MLSYVMKQLLTLCTTDSGLCRWPLSLWVRFLSMDVMSVKRGETWPGCLYTAERQRERGKITMRSITNQIEMHWNCILPAVCNPVLLSTGSVWLGVSATFPTEKGINNTSVSAIWSTKTHSLLSFDKLISTFVILVLFIFYYSTYRYL